MYIWQLSALQLKEKTLVTGTVLEGQTWGGANATTWLGNFFYVMRSYFQEPYGNRKLTIRCNGEEVVTSTDKKGRFLAMLNGPVNGKLEFHAEGKVLPVPQDYPYLFPESDAGTEVISDIDDTVILSHTASFVKRISTILFLLPQHRKTIVFTHQLLQSFEDQGFRVSYLSKSESNLFGLINSIFQYRGLPEGALLLTPYLKLHQLFKPNKGKDYKLEYLKLLFDHMPEKQFILLGDDTQRDMDVYARIAEIYPERIVRIYIRQTRFKRNEQQQDKWEKLLATGVDAVYFEDSDPADPEIAKLETLSGRA